MRWSGCALCALWACTNDVDPPGETTGPDPQVPDPYPLDDVLRFHHLQAKGTHNSYHVQTSTLPEWAYTHAELDIQLEEQGVRQFELDVYWDSTLGAHVVQHVPIVDPGTTCATFVDCVATLDSWSSAHPGHHPLLVLVETKDPYEDDGHLDSLDEELLQGMPIERLIRPADVQGAHPDLRTAIATDGWPTLGALRGRTLFVLHDSGARRDAYVADILERPMFPDAQGDVALPYAAVHTMNEPASDPIATVVAEGHLVRTRADDDPSTADTEGATRLQLALESGAHFVSTDFPVPVDGVEYWMELPEGTPSRCNPSTAPAECSSLAIEDPEKL
jgi:hypothetical protein